MIELILTAHKKTKATYNLYERKGIESKFDFVEALSNTQNYNADLEWHHKTLYPYNLNLHTLERQDITKLPTFDTYKCFGNN